MNAPTAFPHADSRLATVRKEASWPNRWQAFRETSYWRAALLTISREAAAGGIHQDNELASVAYDAATVSDPDDRAMFIADVERIFAEYAEAEREADADYRAEVRGACSNPNSARWV